MAYRILENGKVINTIIADETFCKDYCEKNGYTYEKQPDPAPAPDPAPTELEQLRADVDFIAMETGVDL